MTDDDRCPWSDLPRDQCAHCDPTTRTPAPPPDPDDPDDQDVDVTAQGEDIAATIVNRPHIELPHGRMLPDDIKTWKLHDYVAALCDHVRHGEPREVELGTVTGSTTKYTVRHITVSAPLILQLQHAAATSRGMDNGNRVFGSSPSAALDALALAMDIENNVHRALRRDHGIVNSYDDYPETISAVRHLGSLTVDPKSDNARMIRSWWAGARVITGWDRAAFKPNNTCPLCGMRGSLRIKYPTGFCVECREHWDEETIGLLVEHIRAENHEDDESESEAG